MDFAPSKVLGFKTNKAGKTMTNVLATFAFALATAPGLAGQALQPAPLATPPVAAGAPQGAVGTQTPPPPNQVAAVSPDYVIGPGDSLAVNVWKEPTVSGTFPVRPDGMISLALIGDLPASGLTPAHLSDQIADRLRKFINEPAVTVAVLGVNSKRIFLIGEVAKPGEQPLIPGLTPLQAIASAGGLSPYANGKRIYILRGAAPNQSKIPFDYKKAIKDGNLQGVTLAPGDTIVVP